MWVTCIRIQCVGSSSLDAAQAVDHALELYNHPDVKVQFSNHTIDACGGGTQMDLFLKLCDVNQVKNHDNYIYTTCSLHGLNLYTYSPTTNTMGNGRLLKQNALQTLHTTYNFSQKFEAIEWATVWTLLTGVLSMNVKYPVTMRWECIGETIKYKLNYCEQ